MINNHNWVIIYKMTYFWKHVHFESTQHFWQVMKKWRDFWHVKSLTLDTIGVRFVGRELVRYSRVLARNSWFLMRDSWVGVLARDLWLVSLGAWLVKRSLGAWLVTTCESWRVSCDSWRVNLGAWVVTREWWVLARHSQVGVLARDPWLGSLGAWHVTLEVLARDSSVFVYMICDSSRS